MLYEVITGGLVGFRQVDIIQHGDPGNAGLSAVALLLFMVLKLKILLHFHIQKYFVLNLTIY